VDIENALAVSFVFIFEVKYLLVFDLSFCGETQPDRLHTDLEIYS